jgi:hypothetical protein
MICHGWPFSSINVWYIMWYSLPFFLVVKRGKTNHQMIRYFLKCLQETRLLIHHFVTCWHCDNETKTSQGWQFHLSLSDTLWGFHHFIFQIGKGKNESQIDKLFHQDHTRNGQLIHHFVTCLHLANETMTYHGRLFSSVTKWYIVWIATCLFHDWERRKWITNWWDITSRLSKKWSANPSLCDLLTSRKWDNDIPRMTISSVIEWYIICLPTFHFPDSGKGKRNHKMIWQYI